MLRLTLRPSPYIAGVLIAAHAAAALALTPLEIPGSVRLALVLGVLIRLAHSVWRYALLRSRLALVTVELRSNGDLAVLRRDGEWRNALLLGSTYVSPLLTVLNLRVAGQRFICHVLIVPDNCEPDTFRRLRVWLRWAYRRHIEQPNGLPSGNRRNGSFRL
jgi:toxin CptA